MGSYKTKIFYKAIIAWIIIVPFAILNGGIRDNLLAPLIGIRYALPISGIILCLFIFFDAYIAIPHFGKRQAKSFVKIGLLWLFLTMAFEFSMLFANGNSIGQMLNAYNIATGNLWLLVVITTGIAPYFAARTRHYIIK